MFLSHRISSRSPPGEIDVAGQVGIVRECTAGLRRGSTCLASFCILVAEEGASSDTRFGSP
ncbi:MAG: hypothetical protein DSY81_07000 [Bacillota bacterium]|nr:MAG: hypothetical protein DSY81_07000 [Bacillota bacterium]